MVYSVFQLLQHALSYVQFYCDGIEHHFQTCVLVSLLAYVTPYIHFKRTTVSDFLNYCSETWSCDDYFALTAMKSQTNQYIVEFDFTHKQYGKRYKPVLNHHYSAYQMQCFN